MNTERTRAVEPSDPSYPLGLHDLHAARIDNGKGWRAPPTLYVRGMLPPAPIIAVVGSRHASRESETWTAEVVRELADQGWAIGSGGAVGIDAAAHQAAIDAGAATIVATAGGLDGPLYPRNHGELFRQVLVAGGALVSLDPDGTRKREPDFFPRNRMLAAMSVAVLAVELRPKRGHGGTGHTARAALALGRPLFTVAHPPWSRGGAGAIAMLRLGAQAVSSATEIRELIARHLARPPPLADSPSPSVKADAPGDTAQLLPDERAVLAALAAGPAHLDDVCARTGLPPAQSSRALLTCAVRGVVVEGPAGFYRLRAPP